jgi:hypothetical protein
LSLAVSSRVSRVAAHQATSAPRAIEDSRKDSRADRWPQKHCIQRRGYTNQKREAANQTDAGVIINEMTAGQARDLNFRARPSGRPAVQDIARPGHCGSKLDLRDFADAARPL